MRKIKIILLLIFCLILSAACNKKNTQDTFDDKEEAIKKEAEEKSEEDILNEIIQDYGSKIPTKWGEYVDDVVNKINTNDKIIALTFDACGGKNGSGYDKELIEYLINEEIPATLFVNYRWIEVNKEIFLELSKNELFEIENHGTKHRPLSVSENSIYGIEGTNSVQGVIDEIKLNEEAIYNLTGKKTKYFRSGTAYYDEIAVQIANTMGYKVIGYSVNGDAGATFTSKQVETSL